MQAKIPASLSRIVTCVIPVLFLAGCFGQGDGPTRIPGTPAPPPPPEGFCDVINFEVACEPFEFINFAGGEAGIIDNPDKNGLNTTDRVARMLKFDPGNGETFGGTKLLLDSPIDFAEGESFTMKVWASRPVPVLFKLEPGALLERTRSHSGSGEWEELCFDFTGAGTAGARTELTLIFDLGVTGEAATDPANWTFFFDEITQVASCDGVVGPTPVNLPVTFEGAPESYDFGPEAGFAGGVATVIANPDRSGVNTTAQTARMQKFPAEVFGGAKLVLDDLIDFGEGEAFNMKVWSARPVPVLFKLEDAVSGLPNLGKESIVDHSGSGSWEQLCFDFSGDLAGFSSDAITFIFDPTVLGDAENNPDDWTFYFDEITQVASCGGGGADPGIIPDAVVYATDPNITVDLPPPVVDDLGSGSTFDFFFAGDADFNPALRVLSGGDTGGGIEGNIVINGGFETGAFDGWQRFENNGVLAIVTDNPSSGTYAANLLVPVREPGDSAADPLIKNANLQAGNLTPGAVVTVSFDMRGTLSGAGGVVFAELFSELAGEGVSKAEILSGGPLAPTAEWSTYSFTTTLGPDVGGGVTLQLKASCGPVEGCGVDVVVDNVSIVLGTGDVAVVNGAGAASILSATGGVAKVNATGANVGLIALTGYAPGFAAGFETFNFKVKGLPTNTIEVRFIEGGDTSRVYDVTTYAGSTELGNGWYQLSIPLTDFAATIDSNQGFVLGPLGEQAAPFSFLLTDIGFSGTAGGGGGAGIIPDVVIFSSSVPPDLVFGVDYTGFEPFGSGSVFDNNVTTDPDFSPAFGVTTGDGYGAQVGQFAIVGFQAGFASSYATLDFKAKGLNNDLIRVKFLDDGAYLDIVLTSSPFSTGLGNGWYQVSVPLTSVTGVDTATALLFETDNTAASAFTFLLTDFGFSGTAGGGGGGEPGDTVGDIAVNGDFETGTLEGWESLPGGGTATVSTDNPAAGTYSVNLIVPVRGEGDPPVDNLLKNANLEAGNLTPGDTVTVSFDMRGSLSGAGGVVFAELFSELSGGGTSKSDILGGGPLTPTANWTNYSFTTTLGPDVSGGVTLQLKASCGPVVGCGVDVFIDNVSITIGSGGTGGGGFAAITFDDPDTTYTLTGFNGAEGSFVTNDPAGGANMVAQVDRSAAAQADAGTVVSTGENSTIQTLPLDAQNTQMTVRVYSPSAGVPVRLKIEDSSDANVAVETEAATTAVGTWETLTFNFLNEAEATTPFDPAATYDKVTIFFNFGTDGATAGAQTFYLDDIDVLAGTGGGGEGVELVVNGDFETGDLTDWNASGTGGVIGIESPGSSGSFAVNVDASGGPFIGTLRQANLGAGQLTPGQEVTVSFDWKGTAGIGGIARISVISEPGGAGTAQVESIIDTGAFPADWTTVGPTTFNLGPEVGGGVTFQVFVECGAESSCVADVSLDNISIIAALSGGGGGGDSGPIGDAPGSCGGAGELSTNCDFETGDLTGWELADNGGLIEVVATGGSSSLFAGHLVAGPTQNPLIKQFELAAGVVTPGDSVTISFDMKGSLQGDGGVVFAEFFSEGDPTTGEILTGGPIFPTIEWTTYTFTPTAGADVTRGITFQLAAVCGSVSGCGVDVYVDNVSVIIN